MSFFESSLINHLADKIKKQKQEKDSTQAAAFEKLNKNKETPDQKKKREEDQRYRQEAEEQNKQFSTIVESAETFDDLIDIIAKNQDKTGGPTPVSGVKKIIENMIAGKITAEEMESTGLWQIDLENEQDGAVFLNDSIRRKIIDLYKLQKVREDLEKTK